jgi:hypothetical protein
MPMDLSRVGNLTISFNKKVAQLNLSFDVHEQIPIYKEFSSGLPNLLLSPAGR